MRTKTWRRSSVGDGASVVGRCRRPSSRRSVAEARWCQSPRFSASLIGLRVRVCGGAAGTVNVGSRAPACLTFIWRCARGVHCHKTTGAPDQDASRIGKPIRRSSREIISPTDESIFFQIMSHLNNFGHIFSSVNRVQYLVHWNMGFTLQKITRFPTLPDRIRPVTVHAIQMSDFLVKKDHDVDGQLLFLFLFSPSKSIIILSVSKSKRIMQLHTCDHPLHILPFFMNLL
jgi:hypothetical protein